jgi:hypothetical protein
MGKAQKSGVERASVNQWQNRKARRTYRAPALLFRAAKFEIWQARYTWIFLQLCVDSDEELGCTRISIARGALDLWGTVGFFASTESVTKPDKVGEHFPYYSFPWRVGNDGGDEEDQIQ